MAHKLKWPSKQIRRTFIEFFREKEHKFVPSSSVIPKKGQGTYFVNAGMNQFKPIFLGTVSADSEMSTYRRTVNSQKCVRVGGKHNDLEDVGRDSYHHTFFEMLGNWSFGDYFKKEACSMALELLVDVYKIPRRQLYITYFGGDKKLGLEADLECREIWLELGFPEKRVLPFGSADNFWDMGETGPCGPCTEIHYDHTGSEDVASKVNTDNPQVVELWNLVFMQYDRQGDGSLKRLPHQHVDTGMGLERLCAVLQGKTSNYDTDLFTPIFEYLDKNGNQGPYTGSFGAADVSGVDTAYRIVADHLRMITVALADGLRPGAKDNEFRLAQIMDRCFLQAHHILGVPPSGLLSGALPVIAEVLGDTYPEIEKHQKQIGEIVDEMEKSFMKKDREIQKVFFSAMEGYNHPAVLSGSQIHEIHSGKFGRNLSFIMISDLCREKGIEVDREGYEEIRAEQETERDVNKPTVHRGIDQHYIEELKRSGVPPTDDSTKYSGEIELISAVVAVKVCGDDLELILDKTCFYAEAGGQVADRGTIITDRGCEIEITDVQSIQDYVVHYGTLKHSANNSLTSNNTEGVTVSAGETVYLCIDSEARDNCMRNHSATHIINYALEACLGGVAQAGSVVKHEKLQFDFTCAKKQITNNNLRNINTLCKKFIFNNYPVRIDEIALDHALKLYGLRTVLDADYPQNVRVVTIGEEVENLSKEFSGPGPLTHSLELCGGTHVSQTGDIGQIVITNLLGMEGVGKKRLVAITGKAAAKSLEEAARLERDFNRLEQLVKTGQEINTWTERVHNIQKTLSSYVDLPKLVRDSVSQQLSDLQQKILNQQKNKESKSLLEESLQELLQEHEDKPYVVAEFDFTQGRDLMEVIGRLSLRKPLMLVTRDRNGKAQGVCYVPPNLKTLDVEKWAGHVCAFMDGATKRPQAKKLSKISHQFRSMVFKTKENDLKHALLWARTFADLYVS